VLQLPRDPLPWFDEPIRVGARVVARRELAGETTLRPRFDCGGTVDLRGAGGARGGEAEHGGPGEPGPEVHVALAYVDTRHSGRLVLVRVQRGREQPEFHIVDPRHPEAPFVIDARGGAGGRGGQGVTGVGGSAGVDGSNGTDGVDCADGTSGQAGTDGHPGGPGGPGGNGGPGGRGGRVIVHYDARFPELPARIQVRVEGGEAGDAGPGGTGGRGGRGGRGGKAGKGGASAVTSTGSSGGAAACNGSDGSNGTDGANGLDGRPGPAGEPGLPGPPGESHEAPADVTELFADEIKRGIPIVTGTDGAGRRPLPDQVTTSPGQ
jgi:hypothetical protein